LDSRWEAKIPAGVIVAVFGAVSFLLMLYRIIDPPIYVEGRSFYKPRGFHFEATPLVGIYLALAATPESPSVAAWRCGRKASPLRPTRVTLTDGAGPGRLIGVDSGSAALGAQRLASQDAEPEAYE
jgi:hypothetical protein